MQHHVNYVHDVLLQLQNLHGDDYDENDGHDETHLLSPRKGQIVCSS